MDDHILRVVALDERDVLIDRISSTLIPVRAGSLLIRRQYMHASVQTVQIPWLTVADVLIQNQRLILGKNTYSVDTRVYAVR